MVSPMRHLMLVRCQKSAFTLPAADDQQPVKTFSAHGTDPLGFTAVNGGLVVDKLAVHADARHRHLLEQVRGGHRRVGVAGERRLELRITKRVPECLHRLPDGVVDEHPAPADAAVQLGGDEARLLLEVGGIGRPGLQQGVAVLGPPGRC